MAAPPRTPALDASARGALCAVLIVALAPGGVVGQQDSVEIDHGPPPAVVPSSLMGRTSVTTTPGERYDAGPVHRFFFGDLNRDIWTIPFTVPVLDLDEFAGGLEVTELSGGKQTLGLRMAAKDGRVYQFRSIVKSPERAIPDPLLKTPLDEVAQDQMGAMFPLGALIVSELVEAAEILVAKPTVVIMPDDPRLGDYRDAFAGRMGWIEVRPNEREGDRPGFAGSDKITGSEALYERLQDDPSDYVDQRKLVRARLIDFLVHDWDRHMDQWRWASFPEGDRVRWEPIPRDRDWAFSTIDGIFPRLSATYFPQYTGFNDERVDMVHLTWSAQLVDRTLLTGLEREDFLAEARWLQERMTDSLFERAVGLLPGPYHDVVAERFLAGLRARRDRLPELADEFYRYLAGWVDVFGTEEEEHLTAERTADGRLRVTIRSPGVDGHLLYDRTFRPDETREVRVYLLEGDDVVHIGGAGAERIRLNIIPGDGSDRIVDATSGDRIGVFGREDDDELDLGDGAWATSRFIGDPKVDDAYLILSRRDWGRSTIPRPEVSYDSDEGPYVGGSITRYGYGFQFDPYRSRYQVKVMNGLDPDQWIGSLEFERPFANGQWRVWASAEGYTERPTRFFGFGNEIAAPGGTEEYRTVRTSLGARTGIRFRPDDVWEFSTSVGARAAEAVKPGTETLDRFTPYGSGEFNQADVRVHARYDRRDDPHLPRLGFLAEVDGQAAPPLFDVGSAFGTARTTLRGYVPLGGLPLDPVVHLRAVGHKTWGPTPFEDLAYLGGSSTFPGLTKRRFLGTSMASAASLLRLRLAEVDRFSGLDVGVHGLATTGRVWYPGEESDLWHTAVGGGLWVHLQSLGRTVSLTLADSEEELRYYLDFGFIF